MSIYKNKKIIVLFLAPVTIGLLVFVYYPLIQTIIGSLYKWVSYSPDRKWVGIANYLAIFQKKGSPHSKNPIFFLSRKLRRASFLDPNQQPSQKKGSPQYRKFLA